MNYRNPTIGDIVVHEEHSVDGLWEVTEVPLDGGEEYVEVTNIESGSIISMKISRLILLNKQE